MSTIIKLENRYTKNKDIIIVFENNYDWKNVIFETKIVQYLYKDKNMIYEFNFYDYSSSNDKPKQNKIPNYSEYKFGVDYF